MRTAFWVNLVLLSVAVLAPRFVGTTETAALLFAIPMALILVVGAAVASRAYILARRENQSPRWTAFLPLSLFLVGILATLVLVYSDVSWVKPPVEVTPAQR